MEKTSFFRLKILNKTNLFELILVFNFLVFGWFLEKLIIVWEAGETTISCNTTPACTNEWMNEWINETFILDSPHQNVRTSENLLEEENYSFLHLQPEKKIF